MLATLCCSRCHAGYHLAVRLGSCEVTNNEHLGVPLDTEVGAHWHTARPINIARDRSAERRCSHSSTPQDGGCGDHASLGGYPVLIDCSDWCRQLHVDTELDKLAPGRRRQLLGERTEHTGPRLDEHDSTFGRVD